jgi:putative addiction module component (TIGR02574 family)
MSFAQLMEEAKKLSPSEKLTLAIELWDELNENLDDIPLTETQLAELNRRHAEYLRNPHDVLTWDQVKTNIRSRSR